jgi:hypothetical protein
MVCVMQHASRASPNYPAMAYSTIRSASTAGSNPNGDFVHTGLQLTDAPRTVKK